MTPILFCLSAVITAITISMWKHIRVALFVWRKCSWAEFNHAVHVAFYLRGTGLSSVGLIHDMVEDKHATLEQLIQKFDLRYYEGYVLERITRKENEEYFEYIRRVHESPLATEVKLADLRHNVRRCASKPRRFDSLMRRYIRAYMILR